jgi:hypothetical protein
MKTFKQFMLENDEQEAERYFKFNVQQLQLLWKDINKVCFNNEMDFHKTHITIEHSLSKYASKKDIDKRGSDAEIMGFVNETMDGIITIEICEKIQDARELMEIFAHEMVHQYLAVTKSYDEMWDIGHKKEFMDFAPAIAKYHNIELHGAELP